MVSVPITVQDSLRSYGVQAATVGVVFTALLHGAAYVLSVPYAVTITVTGASLSIVSAVGGKYYELRTDERKRDNREFGEAAKELKKERDSVQEDLRDYQRMTRVLEDREVDLATLIENQTESNQIALLVFRDQNAPEDHDFYEVEEEDHKSKFIRYRTKEEFDGETISSFTWMLPPSVVAEEGLENAKRDELKDWFRENVYDYYDDEAFQANVLLMGLMDIDSIFSITKEETKLGKFAENLIEYDDEFTEEDFYEALAEERINMLEEVKDGRLVFFLPKSLDEDTVERIRDQSEVAKSELNDGGLRELAGDESVDPLRKGFKKLAIPQPEELAKEVVKEAQMWEEKIKEA